MAADQGFREERSKVDHDLSQKRANRTKSNLASQRFIGTEARKIILMTKSRSISTVGGSGATCTGNFFELFFQNR